MNKSPNNSSGRSPSRSIEFVLLRGLAREARHWGAFPAALQRAFPDEKVIVDTLDLPGAGRFSEMSCPLTITEIVEFVRGQWLARRVARVAAGAGSVSASRVYLIAVSLGGMVAAEWLQQWPEDFRASVLINTSFRGTSKLWERLRPSVWPRLAGLLKGGAARGDALARERIILQMISNRAERRESTAHEWAGYALSRPMKVENFARQLLAAARFTADAEPPAVPTLVIASESDRFVSPRCSRAIAAKWRLPLIVHPDAGHDLPLDEPEWLADEVRKWVSS